MTDLDHRIFTWRPEIVSRQEAAGARELLAAIDAAMQHTASGLRPPASMQALRDHLAAALAEWDARPWPVRLAGRRRVSADGVTLGRWLEHAYAYALQQYNAQEPRP